MCGWLTYCLVGGAIGDWRVKLSGAFWWVDVRLTSFMFGARSIRC
jgi:hypothetical protein